MEKYRRPGWTFNKIVYCEKEGFFPILIDARWPERHDFALLTSKGFASRAARDVLDLLGETDEELTFFCLHDADGPGTLIAESLNEATKARPSRRVKIVNLGLEPDEGIAMGLPVEPVERKDGKPVPVAAYVSPECREWLQEHRIELNAMDTPQFLAWLDAKMEVYSGKLLPPVNVIRARLEQDTENRLRDRLTAEALKAYGVDGRLAAAIVELRAEFDRASRRLPRIIEAAYRVDLAEHWTAPVQKMASDLALKNGPKGKIRKRAGKVA